MILFLGELPLNVGMIGDTFDDLGSRMSIDSRI